MSASVVIFTTTSTTGNRSLTGVGFQPKVLRLVLSGLRNGTTESVVHLSEGGTDGTYQYCNSISSMSGTDHTTSFSDRVINLETPSGTTIVANIVSMDADGFTLNFTSTVAGYRVSGEALA